MVIRVSGLSSCSAFNTRSSDHRVLDGRGKNSGVSSLETIGPSDISPYLHHLLCRSLRKKERETFRVDRLALVNSVRILKYHDSLSISRLPAPLHLEEVKPVFLIARERFFPRSTSYDPRTHGTLHHMLAHRASRIQDERRVCARVWHARAVSLLKTGLTTPKSIYLPE